MTETASESTGIDFIEANIFDFEFEMVEIGWMIEPGGRLVGGRVTVYTGLFFSFFPS